MQKKKNLSNCCDADVYADANYYAEADDVDSVDSMLMDISTLRAATGDFAESNKLGEGGFGAVYKVLKKEKKNKSLNYKPKLI